MSGTVENATATVVGVQNGPGVFNYTITLTDTGTTTIGTFWFAWDDVPDQDFMSQMPTNVGAPTGWSAFVTQHVYPGGTGFGIEWVAGSVNARLNPNDVSSAFTFTSTETPAQIAAVSPFDNTFQTTSSFVYQGGAFATPGGNIVASVACFRAGTRVLTPRGDIPVEELGAGDTVVTAAGESRPILWMGRRRVACDGHEQPEQVWPVRIARGALARAIPHSDLYLSPDHALFFDGVLVPVKHLINGTTIASVPVPAVTYYHLELDDHDVVLAEGAPVETYLDTGDRAKFDGVFRLAGFAPTGAPEFSREAGSDLELVVTGPILERIRRRLAARAAHAYQEA